MENFISDPYPLEENRVINFTGDYTSGFLSINNFTPMEHITFMGDHIKKITCNGQEYDVDGSDIKAIKKVCESSGWNIHDKYKNLELNRLKKIVSEDRLPFSVMCLNLTGDLNVGTIIRTAHILGAERVIVFGRRKIDNRSLVGSHHYFPVIKIDGVNDDGEIDADQFQDIIKGYNLVPVACETYGIPYRIFEWVNVTNQEGNICLIMGNEGLGIPQNIMDKIKYKVKIDQKGVIRSLNVSSAFAIIASELSYNLNYHEVFKDEQY